MEIHRKHPDYKATEQNWCTAIKTLEVTQDLHSEHNVKGKKAAKWKHERSGERAAEYSWRTDFFNGAKVHTL